jgi:hypothetical protein
LLSEGAYRTVSLKSIMIPLVCDFPILRGIMRHK